MEREDEIMKYIDTDSIITDEKLKELLNKVYGCSLYGSNARKEVRV